MSQSPFTARDVICIPLFVWKTVIFVRVDSQLFALSREDESWRDSVWDVATCRRRMWCGARRQNIEEERVKSLVETGKGNRHANICNPPHDSEVCERASTSDCNTVSGLSSAMSVGKLSVQAYIFRSSANILYLQDIYEAMWFM